ncbi:antibiotic biosynthesis monooxygenase [Niveibacterium sp. SC-1]|uniref:putative quinol monooxygenase n=1 Tax=Niveibacterium sp. SC-1 TaxID=3135646 RepID=UPI00311EE906
MQLLFAELQCRPETASELEHALIALAAAAREEAGNLVYAVHRPAEEPARFLVYELYRDAPARDAHLARAQVQALLGQFDRLLAAPPRVLFCDTVAYGAAD